MPYDSFIATHWRLKMKSGSQITLNANYSHGAMRGKQVTLVRHVHFSVWVVYCPALGISKFINLSA
jgi:hypothetical protein